MRLAGEAWTGPSSGWLEVVDSGQRPDSSVL